MAAKFTVGQKVRQIMPAPIEGEVSGFALDQTTGDIHVHVKQADGQERVFHEDNVEAVE